MELGTFLGITAGITLATGYIFYIRNIFKDSCTPNITSWTLWVFIALLNAPSYIEMSRDLVKSTLPITCATLRSATLLLIFIKGKWKMPNKYNLSALALGVVAAIVWRIYKNAACANLILQACYIIAVIPTYGTILQNAEKEKSHPWFLWAAGHSLGISTVLARWSGQFQDLAFSGTGAIVNIIAGILSCRKKSI